MDDPGGGALGVVQGIGVVVVVLFVLRVAGLEPLPALGIADVLGCVVAGVVCRRRLGPGAPVGVTVSLTLAFSLLFGTLVLFLLAVFGLG